MKDRTCSEPHVLELQRWSGMVNFMMACGAEKDCQLPIYDVKVD